MLVHCETCTTAYPPDTARCPHCGGIDRHEPGEAPALLGPARCPHCDYPSEGDMAKISKEGGPTSATSTSNDVEAEAHLDPAPGLVEVDTTVDPVPAVDEDQGHAEAESVTATAEPAAAAAVTGDDTPDDDPVVAVIVPDRPPGNATTQTWLEYVYAIGGDVEDLTVDDITRAELIAMADAIEAREG